ncbi:MULTISPECIES: hypothetical protein [Cupriavidus]|uniref:Uncharacterized protein n=1 Tax=Cupriavidus taiwanensis TaxID=164546 RepID=A0A375D182_9BURK|nr:MULTISPECIES: hypothetical protein [Cupriavidus]MEC3765080.1 hypothetical protein [Cupriavidus sp. SS-3]SOY90371.1 hypothetical protein; putative membrane protein [Cupriavidus taiwanensis]SOY91292.1 hypothetical protein; putative membrane protein [Cupriavidus taiwanensis]SPD63942.1 conserved protein of unknown function [Cupriavidus taiwanensis]
MKAATPTSAAAVIVELLAFWAAMLAAYLLMKRAGCFSQPVLYPDLEHPLRYWWAQRLGRQPAPLPPPDPPPSSPERAQQKTRRA